MAREAGPKRRQPKASAARRAQDAQRVQRTIEDAINSGEIIAVGVLNLVKNTILTALVGVQDVGAALGVAGVTAVRGSIKAAAAIGGDLGAVAREAIRGTVTAAEQIGGELGGVARSAARGAVNATGEVGGDVGTAARRAVEGTVAAARELGADVVGLARSAAEGAVEAADHIGDTAGRAVRATLSGTVAGVRTLVRDVSAPGPRTRPRRAPALARPRGTRSTTRRGRAPESRGTLDAEAS